MERRKAAAKGLRGGLKCVEGSGSPELGFADSTCKVSPVPHSVPQFLPLEFQYGLWEGCPQDRSFPGLLASRTSNLPGEGPGGPAASHARVRTSCPRLSLRLTFPSPWAPIAPAPARGWRHLERLRSGAPQGCWALG